MKTEFIAWEYGLLKNIGTGLIYSTCLNCSKDCFQRHLVVSSASVLIQTHEDTVKLVKTRCQLGIRRFFFGWTVSIKMLSIPARSVLSGTA